MFDIGWSEMFVVVVVMILVVGPKDLPAMLRNIGKTIGNVRRMASDFQGQFNDALKEAELHEIKDEANKAAEKMKFAPLEDAKKSMEEFTKQVKEERGDLEKAVNDDKPSDTKKSDSSDAVANEADTVKTAAVALDPEADLLDEGGEALSEEASASKTA